MYYLSHKCQMCQKFSVLFWTFSGKKPALSTFSFAWNGYGSNPDRSDPDRHALDADHDPDPDPTK